MQTGDFAHGGGMDPPMALGAHWSPEAVTDPGDESLLRTRAF